jgi:hypothetical protein
VKFSISFKKQQPNHHCNKTWPHPEKSNGRGLWLSGDSCLAAPLTALVRSDRPVAAQGILFVKEREIMNAKKFPIVLALVVLVLAALACEVSASTAKVADAWMSTDEAGDARVTSFAQDADFFAQVDLQNAPDDTALKAVWTAVEAQDTDPNLVITETEFITGSGLVNFNLTNENLWPTGKYKVDIYMGGQLAQTLEFEVR